MFTIIDEAFGSKSILTIRDDDGSELLDIVRGGGYTGYLFKNNLRINFFEKNLYDFNVMANRLFFETPQAGEVVELYMTSGTAYTPALAHITRIAKDDSSIKIQRTYEINQKQFDKLAKFAYHLYHNVEGMVLNDRFTSIDLYFE